MKQGKICLRYKKKKKLDTAFPMKKSKQKKHKKRQ